MADYSTCIHEGAHAVAASLLDVSWHGVTVNPMPDGSSLGRLLRDRGEVAKFLNDEDDWRSSAFAITCLAGPVAQARWIEGEYAERIDIDRIVDFGGQADLDGARAVSEIWDISMQNLLNHAIQLVHTDRVWLAVQRTADALANRRTLVAYEVDALVGKKTKGAGQW